jgi:tripartite-type tricarboxylate transporter receptor subunit TctC
MGVARWISGLLVAALALTGARSALAQDFPSRIIRFVVAFPPGGPTDFVARLLADRMKGILGQTVLIENKAGANAAIGAEYVAKSQPDGYTLFFTTMGAVAINPSMRSDLPYDPLKDFAPVTLVVNTPDVLVVPSDLEVKTAKDFAEYAKARPGVVTMASTGVGSPPHLALELFQSAANIKVVHVPYRGAAPALTDLLGGQVQAMFADLPVLMPHIVSGRLKPLGTASAQRAEALPNVPTLDEQGLPNIYVDNWYALFAPAGTPAPVIAKLGDAAAAALNDPEVRRKLVESGAKPAPGTPKELSRLLRNDLERWGRVIREKGIKPES